LGVSRDRVAEAMSADGCFTPDSLDAVMGEGGMMALADLIGERDPGYARCEGHVLLVNLLRGLDAREQEVLRLRFVEGWTQERIGRRLGVSQMQVSRMLGRVIKDLGAKAAA